MLFILIGRWHAYLVVHESYYSDRECTLTNISMNILVHVEGKNVLLLSTTIFPFSYGLPFNITNRSWKCPPYWAHIASSRSRITSTITDNAFVYPLILLHDCGWTQKSTEGYSRYKHTPTTFEKTVFTGITRDQNPSGRRVEI